MCMGAEHPTTPRREALPCQAWFAPWLPTIMPAWPQWRTPQVTVVALWGLGMVRARAWARTAVSALVATVQGRPEHPLRPRGRAWDDAAPAQRGTQQQALQ